MEEKYQIEIICRANQIGLMRDGGGRVEWVERAMIGNTILLCFSTKECFYSFD